MFSCATFTTKVYTRWNFVCSITNKFYDFFVPLAIRQLFYFLVCQAEGKMFELGSFDSQIKINRPSWRTKIGLWQNLIRFRGIDVSSVSPARWIFIVFFWCRSVRLPPVDNRTLFEKNEKGNEILIRKLSLVKWTAFDPTRRTLLPISRSCFY